MTWSSSQGCNLVHTKKSKYKSPGPDEVADDFHQIFKDEIIPILYNLFQKIGAERILPNPFFEDSIPLIPKPDKDMTGKLQTIYLS